MHNAWVNFNLVFLIIAVSYSYALRPTDLVAKKDDSRGVFILMHPPQSTNQHNKKLKISFKFVGTAYH